MHLSKLWAGGTNHLCRFINLYLRISVWYSRNWIELDTPYTAMTPRAAAVLKAALLLNQVNCCYHNYCKKMIIFWNEVIKLTHLMLSSVYFVVPQPSAQPIVLSISPSYVCMKQNTIYRRLLESALIFPICLLFPKVHCHIVVFACNPQVTDLKIQKSTLDVFAKIAKTPFF